MTQKKRIYDLAKEYGLSGPDLAKKLKDRGFSQIKGPASVLDDFQVLQIQDELTSARSRLANAVTGYRKALVVFHRSTGRLVPESGVEVVSDPGPTKSR